MCETKALSRITCYNHTISLFDKLLEKLQQLKIVDMQASDVGSSQRRMLDGSNDGAIGSVDVGVCSPICAKGTVKLYQSKIE